jgi:streptogramin lyase
MRICFVFVLSCTTFLMAQLPPSIAEFGRLSSSSSTGIVLGPDGALWFTEELANKIGRMTPGGVVTEYPGLTAGQPTCIVVGPDRALWFADYLRNKISRITTAGVIAEYPLTAGNTFAAGLATSPAVGLPSMFRAPEAKMIHVYTAGIH